MRQEERTQDGLNYYEYDDIHRGREIVFQVCQMHREVTDQIIYMKHTYKGVRIDPWLNTLKS